MDDLEKLRELAEAARDAKLAYLATDNERAWDALMAAMDALGQALQPEAILAILDALKAAAERAEKAERERDDARADLEAESHAARRICEGLDAQIAELRVERDAMADKATHAELSEARAWAQLRREKAELRAERDARPEITAEDAEHFVFAAEHFGMDDEDDDPIRVTWEALRAHAAKAKVTR